MSEHAKPFLLPAGATRRERAMLPLKLVADDSGGLISVCEFTLPGWSSGPVLHRHDPSRKVSSSSPGFLSSSSAITGWSRTPETSPGSRAEQFEYLSVVDVSIEP
jgi:hypothetical protein